MKYTARPDEQIRSHRKNMVLVKEHDAIVMTQDLFDLAIFSDDIDTVVHIYFDSSAVEVGFLSDGDRTINIVRLPSRVVRKLMHDDSQAHNL